MVIQETAVLRPISITKSVHKGQDSCFCMPPENRGYPFPTARDLVSKRVSCDEASSNLGSFESVCEGLVYRSHISEFSGVNWT